MEKQVTLRQQLNAFYANQSFVGDLAKFGYFFDWFCKDSSLFNKAKGLMPKVFKFTQLKQIDLDNTYVIFKNNCPIHGNLYDDFRICEIGTKNVIWTVSPALGYFNKAGKSEVWGRDNNFTAPILEANSWREMVQILKK